MDQEDTKRKRKQPIPRSMDRRITALESKVTVLEGIKERLAEFVFQATTVAFTFTAILIAVVFAFTSNFEFGDTNRRLEFIGFLLSSLLVVNLVWIVLWYRSIKRR